MLAGQYACCDSNDSGWLEPVIAARAGTAVMIKETNVRCARETYTFFDRRLKPDIGAGIHRSSFCGGCVGNFRTGIHAPRRRFWATPAGVSRESRAAELHLDRTPERRL